MNKKVILILVCFLLSCIFTVYINFKHDYGTLFVGENKINLIISDNLNTRVKGLSGVKKMNEDTAMLFVFEELGDYGIWMKDMNFPLDIVWLDDNYIINHIEQGISPNTYPSIFRSNEKSKYVIEFNENTISKYHIKEGDKLTIILK